MQPTSSYTEIIVQPAAIDQPQCDASIIIVSFNTREILRECLQSVIRESANLVVEILVVDNNSLDGSPQMVEAEFPQVQLLRSEINLGFGSANNLALAHARGRYFVLLNSDAFFQSASLEVAIRHMDETPECGLAGGRLIGRDGSWQPSARSFHTITRDLIVLTGLAARFPKSRFFGQFDRTWADQRQAATVDWVPGAFSIIRPTAIEKTGFFDPAFFLYYEEVDLCRRIKQAGYTIWYWPDIVVVHIGGESSRQVKLKTQDISSRSAQVDMWRMRSTLLYYRKYHGSKASIAKWLEIAMYRVTVMRNRFSRLPLRRERERHHLTLIALMKQAWKDTCGGRVSPPRPW
jgi:GT2 family glycosyltransferase